MVEKKPSRAYTDISLQIQEDEEESEESPSQSNQQKVEKDIDTLDLAEELKIPDNDDIISELSAKISNLKNPTKKIAVIEQEIAQQRA